MRKLRRHYLHALSALGLFAVSVIFIFAFAKRTPLPVDLPSSAAIQRPELKDGNLLTTEIKGATSVLQDQSTAPQREERAPAVAKPRYKIDRYVAKVATVLGFNDEQQQLLQARVEEGDGDDRAVVQRELARLFGITLSPEQQTSIEQLLLRDDNTLALESLEHQLSQVLANTSTNIDLQGELRRRFIDFRESGKSEFEARQAIGEWLFSKLPVGEIRTSLESVLSVPTFSGTDISSIEVSVTEPSKDELDRYVSTLSLDQSQTDSMNALLRDSRARFEEQLRALKTSQGSPTKAEILKAFKIVQQDFEQRLLTVLTEQQMELYRKMRDTSTFAQIVE